MKKRLGLVFTSPPGYSQTFLAHKLERLSAHFELSVFTMRWVPARERKGNIIPAFPLKQLKNPTTWGYSFFLLFKLISNWGRLNRYRRMLRLSGLSSSKAWFVVLDHAHMLTHPVDVLHFEFCSTAIGKEQLGEAIGAKMSVSFRGFDVAIVPLNQPGCYHALWPKLAAVHTISDDLVGIAHKLGMPTDLQVTKITPAINSSFFQRIHAIDFSAQPIQLLSVGRLHWKKGFDYALLALADLKKKGWSFEYRIIGDGDEAEALTFAIHQLGLSDCVFLLGKKSPEEVRSYYESTHVYLQPSVQEGFCNAVLEAQSMGCLCIVSDAEGLSENVDYGKCGFIFPRRDSRALSETIERVMLLPIEEKMEISQRASARVAALFDLNKQTQAFVDFYNTL